MLVKKVTSRDMLTMYQIRKIPRHSREYKVQSEKNPQFWGFCRKLACTKIRKNIYKARKHNRRTVPFCISTGGFNFVFYPLSSLNFNFSLFAPTYLFVSAIATPSPDGYKKQKCCITPGTLMRHLALLSLSTNHCASGDSSDIAPVVNSDKYLPYTNFSNLQLLLPLMMTVN